VVIYGTHSPDWMSALQSKADVWRAMPEVKAVRVVPHGGVIPPGWQSNKKSKTVLIPLMEQHSLSCPRGFYTLVPSEAQLMRLGIKNYFMKYMEEIGQIKLCPTHYSSLADIRYPCVIKRVNLCSGIGVALVRSKPELVSCAQTEVWRNQPLVLQEALLTGEEWVTHLVVKNGQILWHGSFAYTLHDNQFIRTPHNVKTLRRVLAPPSVLAAFEACLKPINYSGPCNVDYKLLGEGEGMLKIFEINPRLGGSLMRPDAVDWLQEALSCIINHAEVQYPLA
jgi:carbamoylphosphate synthase large subunit